MIKKKKLWRIRSQTILYRREGYGEEQKQSPYVTRNKIAQKHLDMGSSILGICRNWKVYQSNEKRFTQN